MLLRGLIGIEHLQVRAGNPNRRGVAHRILLRRLVANPLGAPGLLAHKPRLPPTDVALRIWLPCRVPHFHQPEGARRRRNCRPLVAHIQRLARIDPPAIPNVRLALAQQFFARSNQYLVRTLLRASRRVLQLPRKPRRRIVDPQWRLQVVHAQLHRPCKCRSRKRCKRHCRRGKNQPTRHPPHRSLVHVPALRLKETRPLCSLPPCFGKPSRLAKRTLAQIYQMK